MEISYLLYLLLGQLLIYFGMKFPYFRDSKFSYVKQLFSCSECLGVFIFTGLSIVMGEHLFGNLFYFPLVSEVITGTFSSFLMHLLTIGWREKFFVVII